MIKFIKELRSTERGRTVFKFFLYMIFLVFAVIIIFIGNINQKRMAPKNYESQSEYPKEESHVEIEKEELTYLEKQTKLFNANYNFVYTIKGRIDRVYEGSIENGITEGFKETTDSLLHYSIENGIIYKHNFKEKEVYNELYQDLEPSFFDFPNLFNNLNQTSSTIMHKDSKKIYSYKELEGYNIQITTTAKEIISIEIKNNEIEYIFEFTY